MRLARPFVLLALAALLAPRAEASRTSVWESNPPAAVLTTTNAAGLLAPLAPAVTHTLPNRTDAEPSEALRFDLGDVVLVENPREDGFRIGLADVIEPPALRGPPLLDEDPHQAFKLRDPETRIRGLELLPAFRVGASPSLSLWSRQACGFSCREVVSDSRYDPWGLESIFSGLSRKAARDAGRAGARIAGRRAAVLVAEEAAASRVERQIAGRATTSIAKGAAVSGGLRVASGIALGATILGNLAQLVPANDASSPAPSAEDEAAPNDQQIKAESDRLRQALLSQTRNVPSSPVPAAGAGGDGGGDRGCGSGENPREILQTLTDEIVSDFAADPNRVLAMLMPEEIKKGTDPRIARMNFGKAVERRLRDRVAQDPVYGQMFQHVGGANQPDFVGKPGCETFGKMYEVTTATSRSVRDHLGRPYGPGLEFVLYDRP